ncbi:vacuolar-processing enzyme delta-isozyme-like [Abrus precatorius]|uniref:Vacuolar-processing enzyme delta-isozyme-like n=1 Tax=Abrus precatorius TaxID=3816 RepID=A0A8B8KVS0_ABRPR|nr:vacuolar-processing enzyme delta-isozyme-like [Abrus precatorius]
MNLKIKCWVTVIATVWMSLTMSVLEGVRLVPNQYSQGKRWALLVAGSKDYENYRHQADVCHAYQLLKNGGLKDENIIVFMYDDIASNPENPRPGVIINKPKGPNVYKGVPKDYTGGAASVANFFAVLSGNRSALSGGSGKVLKTGPNDIIFIYYTDHGSPGLIGMPDEDYITAKDFVHALKKKHSTKSYKKMVIYLEACESGSMFEGLLPNNINIYVTTASNANESSYAFYCPDFYPSAPPEYTTCLGDTYSISWLEDSDENDLTKETLQKQYEAVRRRTLLGYMNMSSHVMQYGDKKLKNDFLDTYFGGARPASVGDEYHQTNYANSYSFEPSTQTRVVNQHDAHLLYLSHKVKRASGGSSEKLKAQKEFEDEIAHRDHVDNAVHLIGDLLFGKEKSTTVMLHVRPPGQPLVDDWDCFKTLIKTYESHCGALSSYGRKYSRAFANMCNAGISEEQLVATLLQACPKENHDIINMANRTLKELVAPDVNYHALAIQYPNLDADFELKSGLIHLLPKFHGLVGEDPHKHL